YPFADRLYPYALEVIDHLGRFGRTVILSDGDVVFQPRKIQRSGLWDAVEGRVLVFIHKEEALNGVAERFPAECYVMVDDKTWILAAMKEAWGRWLTTILVHQGHYASGAEHFTCRPTPDLSFDRIGDLMHITPALLEAGGEVLAEQEVAP